MDIKDLKLHLIKRILETENESILKEILELLTKYENSNLVEEKMQFIYQTNLQI